MPVCHGSPLRVDEGEERRAGQWRRRKVKPVVHVRPGVIRNLLLGSLLLLAGPLLFVWAANLPAKAGLVSAVFMGHGTVFFGWGLVLLIRGALGKSNDV